MVWKTGDTVYHCRTCGMDPSCAICHECFTNSDHVGHDYWMFSSGGGCCDCGDVEAWKREGFCSRHPGPPSLSLHAHACDALPADERRCAEAVLDALSAAYLHKHALLETPAEAAGARSAAAHPSVAFVQWLMSVATTSAQIRSLIGRHLSSRRWVATAAVARPTVADGGISDAPGAVASTAAASDATQTGAAAASGDAACVTPLLHATALRAVAGSFATGRIADSPRPGSDGDGADGDGADGDGDDGDGADGADGELGGGTALTGGEPGESILDVLLDIEGQLSLGTREELHALYFELMRDMPFKRALLQHVIKHYPTFIQQAAGVALSAASGLSPRDSGSTTFGKFTVQFKGNLVATMVTDGLLAMLLETLHSLLLEAARRRAPDPAVAGAPLRLGAAGALHPHAGLLDAAEVSTCMVRGAWCVVRGAWCVVRGAWCTGCVSGAGGAGGAGGASEPVRRMHPPLPLPSRPDACHRARRAHCPCARRALVRRARLADLDHD